MASQNEAISERALDDVCGYFYDRHKMNRIGHEGNTEWRLTTLTRQLGALSNGIWYDGHLRERADIFTAEDNHFLRPIVSGLTEVTIHTKDREPTGPAAQEGRSFKWAVSIPLRIPSPVNQIFLDDESRELGLFHRGEGHKAVYEFPEEQEKTLTILENHLGEIFYPGSEPKHVAKDIETRFNIHNSN